MTARPKLTAARVRELLDCDPELGTLRWRERPGHPDFNRQWAEKLAGGLDPSTGYLRLMIDGRHYYVHRVVWLHTKGYWAPKDLDHRDRDKINCVIGNLRPATKAQNNANRRTRPGKDGAPRGCRLNRSNKYQVQIEAGGANGKRGRSIYLGSFATAEEAGRVYREAAADLHGEFAFFARPERRAA